MQPPDVTSSSSSSLSTFVSGDPWGHQGYLWRSLKNWGHLWDPQVVLGFQAPTGGFWGDTGASRPILRGSAVTDWRLGVITVEATMTGITTVDMETHDWRHCTWHHCRGVTVVGATQVCPMGDLCLQVNNNGVVSFGTMVPEFTPQPFPLPGRHPFVAPYWADVDTRLGGNVFYRQSQDAQLLARLAQDLAPAVPPGDLPPQPTWAFVATWDRVAYFGAASDKVNTFQAVLASDGVICFVLLNYGDLQWTTGIANQGDPHTGLGGIPAQAGFNSGDDVHYYNVPGSRTPAVQSLSHRSNLGVPGRWAFRVDHFETTEGSPETPGTLPKTPEAPWNLLPPHKTPSVSPKPPRITEEQVYVCGS
uniref:NIDO domain-containing protein n=1 Tax=Taeniopygia guttata TaxID=59729 RepID=A0A674GA76_TAEGU